MVSSSSQRDEREHPAEKRPLLGVIACNRTVGEEIAASVMRRYLQAAARHMEASLVIVPSLPDYIDAPRLASTIDGILLTGSPSNIAARHYEGECADAEGPFDEDRDEVVKRLLEEVIKAGKPALGICRGLQEINVALGGTLRRDLATNDTFIPHHAPPEANLDAMFSCKHDVRLKGGGVLAQMYDAPSIIVNSVHYQGINRLAPDLHVEATAPDGLIEAVSARIGSSSILAVQWHPEWQADRNTHSQALLRHFGTLLRGESLPTDL
ncbi:gamma-glutamyl-gamma-aminobutyrate hydrolase family protein [Microvirga terricola]|uniref:Gamma-glutamyl-gamma-aminobutyrate hydrolase family protein n=1 Tax=Microvirga terricola TaxID=2719797 RepID=A0ABX0V793_9HYPH|nr:gamma-glutamyl-gamma-aminobutyrate hydrolase family protein [Microvirga terricola]NIX75026.1 gamma-glutamyl-gamma-aminobutyrate hydrolase family protein [Microvirga terricola]